MFVYVVLRNCDVDLFGCCVVGILWCGCWCVVADFGGLVVSAGLAVMIAGGFWQLCVDCEVEVCRLVYLKWFDCFACTVAYCLHRR